MLKTAKTMMLKVITRVQSSRLVKDETGAIAPEYGILMIFGAIVAVGAGALLAPQLHTLVNGIINKITAGGGLTF